jgi:hypothetical protein
MRINLEKYNYGRFTGFEFGKDEIEALTKDLDYGFFVSTKEIESSSGIETIEKTSAMIKIFEDPEEQIAIGSSRCRNVTRRSFRIEEFSVEIDSTPIDELFAFHLQCEKERSWLPVPPEELEASVVVCVRYQEELFAGMSAYYEKDFLRVGRIFSRRKSEKYQDLPQVIFASASRRVVFELTRLALNKGFEYLDLGGVSFDEKTKSGITEFKMSFGSEVKPVYLGRYYGENYDDLLKYCSDKSFDLT